jgi:hypothetical protein
MKGDYVSENGLCNTASGLFLSLLLQEVKAHTNLTPRIVLGMGVSNFGILTEPKLFRKLTSAQTWL